MSSSARSRLDAHNAFAAVVATEDARMRWRSADRTTESVVRGNAVARAVLDAWDASILVLDCHARVVFVNAAWERHGGVIDQAVARGTDYLAICDAAAMQDPAAAEIADGVRGVLVGAMPEFEQTYSRDGSARRRCFQLAFRTSRSAFGPPPLCSHDRVDGDGLELIDQVA
jgi:hypothetical protein